MSSGVRRWARVVRAAARTHNADFFLLRDLSLCNKCSGVFGTAIVSLASSPISSSSEDAMQVSAKLTAADELDFACEASGALAMPTSVAPDLGSVLA